MTVNPYAAYPVTGTWAEHASYSAGGVDYPLRYGTALSSPWAGTLRTSGGRGEWAAGWVGSAGRRSILMLDAPVARRLPAQPSPPEGSGDLVAVVFQHQSSMGAERYYAAGEVLGRSGASANGVDYGGDAHLHWHGLTRDGKRVQIESFIGTEPNKRIKENKMLMAYVPNAGAGGQHLYALFAPGFYFEFVGQEAANAWMGQIGGMMAAPSNRDSLKLIKAAALASI